MRTVGEILSKAKKSFITIQSTATVFEALNAMAQSNAGAVLVVEGPKIMGVFSERDYTRKILLSKRQPEATAVHEVMTREVVSVTSDMGLEECLALMNHKGVRHLPVLRQTEIVGFVSILDVVDAVLEERETMIVNLERYVSETWPL